MFHDTSWYLDDIFTIDNLEFEIHIPDIYQTVLQSNKTNTWDKDTSSLDLNIKVIDSDVYTNVPAFTTNAMTSDYLSLIFPGWVVMLLDSHHTMFTFLSLLNALGVAIAFENTFNDLVTLTLTSKLKIAFLTLLPPGA